APNDGAQRKPVDITGYDGISFKIKGGTNPQPVWFEMLNSETQPPAGGGTATCNTVDSYNTRGTLLGTIPSAWTTMYVPFGALTPRYLPAVPSSTTTDCPARPAVVESRQFNIQKVLGFQFAIYPDFVPTSPTPSGNYDITVDDVKLYKSADT